LPRQRRRNLRCQSRVVLDQRDIGCEAAAAGLLQNRAQQIGRHRFSGDAFPRGVGDGGLNCGAHFARRDFVGGGNRIGDENAAGLAQRAAGVDEGCDRHRVVEADRGGEAARPRPESRELVAPVADDRHAQRLQKFQRLRHVEKGLGAGRYDHNASPPKPTPETAAGW